MFERARLTVRVSNMDRSIAFYAGKLGMKLGARFGERFAELEAPGITLLLHEKFEQQPDRTPSGVLSLSLQVADIDAARRDFEARGVVFEGETVETDSLKIAFTSDPDGVPVFLVESDWFRDRS
jgi:catechol 2,3-dioxygenase-like lactoylglutathione lyase family enzyme